MTNIVHGTVLLTVMFALLGGFMSLNAMFWAGWL